jgi:hypothetical protein
MIVMHVPGVRADQIIGHAVNLAANKSRAPEVAPLPPGHEDSNTVQFRRGMVLSVAGGELKSEHLHPPERWMQRGEVHSCGAPHAPSQMT